MTKGAGIALLGCDARSEEDANSWSQNEYEEDSDLVIGLDWQEDYPCHSKCLMDAIQDATANHLRKAFP